MNRPFNDDIVLLWMITHDHDTDPLMREICYVETGRLWKIPKKVCSELQNVENTPKWTDFHALKFVREEGTRYYDG